MDCNHVHPRDSKRQTVAHQLAIPVPWIHKHLHECQGTIMLQHISSPMCPMDLPFQEIFFGRCKPAYFPPVAASLDSLLPVTHRTCAGQRRWLIYKVAWSTIPVISQEPKQQGSALELTWRRLLFALVSIFHICHTLCYLQLCLQTRLCR